MDWLEEISNKAGVPEASLRFLLTLISTIPISLIYRKLIIHQHINIRKTYIALTSLLSFIFFVKYDYWALVPSYVSILTTWSICRIGGDLGGVNRQIIGISSSVFNFGLLLVCFYLFSTDGYGIKRTVHFFG